MNISKQITVGYALMLILMLLISGFSIFSIIRLNKASANIAGRFQTISNLLHAKGVENNTPGQPFSFEKDMLIDSITISDKQVKYSYIGNFTVLAIALLFGGVMTLIFPRVITKPIMGLVDTAKQVANGDYTSRAPDLGRSSELSTLINIFNHMLDKMEHNRSELEKKNNENLELLEATRKFNETLEAKIDEATQELKEKQEELVRSEKLAAIGEIATGVAHEIKNPLTGIYLALDMIRSEAAAPDDLHETVSDIISEINRLDRIIKQLLELGSPKALNLMQCDPNEIVERALDLVSIQSKEKGIKIKKELHSKEQFYVDCEQIEQVVLNLLINGIDAMDDSGTLTVSTKSFDENVHIRIEDTGCGLSDDDIEKIFTPFYSTKEHGTGLGLSISNSIVETHRGKILCSSGNGCGTAFTVVIPKGLGGEENRAMA